MSEAQYSQSLPNYRWLSLYIDMMGLSIFLKVAVAVLTIFLKVVVAILIGLSILIEVAMVIKHLRDGLLEEILIFAVQHILVAVMVWIFDLQRREPAPEPVLLAHVPTLAVGCAFITGIIRGLIYWLDMGNPFFARRSLASDLDILLTILESIAVLFGDELV